MEGKSLSEGNKLAFWMYKTPINLSISYLMFTLLIYYFGPIKWNINNPFILALTLITYYIAFYLGYKSFIRKKIKKYPNMPVEDILMSNFKYTEWTKLFFWISCIYTIIKYLLYTYTYFGGFNLDSLFNFGSSYFDRLHNTEGGTWLTTIIIFTNVIALFWLPIGLVLWKKLGLIDKLLFITTLLFTIVYWFNQGTLKGLGDIVIYTFPSLILLLGKKKFLTGIGKRRSRRRLIGIFIVLFLFIVVFGIMQEQRTEYKGNGTSMVNPMNSQFIKEERETIYPFITNYLSFYMTHGYTGMSLALELDPEWSYGVGASRSLMRTTENLLDVNILQKTYPQRIDNVFGWPNGMYWPTAFTWFASDITFWGIPFLMFFLGWCFAYVWHLFITEQSIVGLVAVCQLLIFIVYLPANNQLFQASENFYANLTLILLLLFRRPFLNDINSPKGRSPMLKN